MTSPPSAPLPDGAPDPIAVSRVLRRLGGAAAPPWLHGEVARRMAERLPAIRLQPEVVMSWWGRLGASDAVLTAAYPKARRIVVEPSEMLGAGRPARPARWWSAERWRSGGAAPTLAEDSVAAGSCQLLWANMMLHACAEPDPALAAWQRALAVDGFVMFSCLGPDSLKELRALYARLGWPAPAQQFIDMHDLGDAMVRAGFADPVMDQERLRLTWASPEALLAELRSMGGNVAVGRGNGLRTPRWRRRLLELLADEAGSDGRIGLEFEIIYGHAVKPEPRPRLAGETRVSLDDMRAMTRASRPLRR